MIGAGGVLDPREGVLDRVPVAPCVEGLPLSSHAPDAPALDLDHHHAKLGVGDNETRLAVRCPEGPVSSDWLARLGPYRVDADADEVFTFEQIHLELVEGVLHLRLEAPRLLPKTTTLARYALAPDDGRSARIFGVGRGKGQRVVAEDGPDGPVLRWSGLRLVRASP